jgi:hypothetical protein
MLLANTSSDDLVRTDALLRYRLFYLHHCQVDVSTRLLRILESLLNLLTSLQFARTVSLVAMAKRAALNAP